MRVSWSSAHLIMADYGHGFAQLIKGNSGQSSCNYYRLHCSKIKKLLTFLLAVFSLSPLHICSLQMLVIHFQIGQFQIKGANHNEIKPNSKRKSPLKTTCLRKSLLQS